MIKAVFFDIDGTLIDTHTHHIPASSKKAIGNLRDLGYKVAIASGRDMKNIQDIDELDTSLFDGFVASNGMSIFNEQKQCISKHTFEPAVITYLIDYANSHNMTLVFETMDDIYVINDCNSYVDISNEYYHEITPPKKDWHGEPIIKISCFQIQNYDFSEVLEHIDIQILASPTTTYDFTLPDISKLSGIQELMNHWNLDANSFMCFGDHDNDVEMILGAEKGIAVKDELSSIELQKIADDVCESAGNDGIYKYLKEHKYI